MNLDLGNIFSRAWKITWNSKILWLFGVLAALGSGGGGGNGGRTNFNYGGGPSNYPSGIPELPPEVGRWFSQLEQAGPTILAIIIAVICVAFFIGLVVYILSLLGQGGLIGGAHLADANGHVTFGEAWEQARRYLWRLFLINLPALVLGLVVALIVIIGAVVSIGLMAGSSSGVGSALEGVVLLWLCVVPLICIIALVGLALRILIFFARFAVVLEDLTPMAAFRRAWEILVANIGPILILGIILVIAGAVFGFIIALPMILAILPAVLGVLGTVATGKAISAAGGVMFALVCCAIWVPVMIFLRGVYETWATSAWTLAYAQFISARPAAPVAPYPLTPGGASA